MGHLYYQCKVPITSVGIIAVRVGPSGEYEYLMIRRKDTLGYIDFMRGKYSIYNRPYIINMLKQMTLQEKEQMRSGDFGLLWQSVWGKPLPAAAPASYRSEELTSRDKYNVLFKGVVCKFVDDSSYTLNHLIDESMSSEQWTEPEWGFPKGRRNPQEKDYDCALREFAEETGISTHHLHNIQNLIPYEEIFTGSNYKSYKHKYYVMFLDEAQHAISLANFEKSEVSLMQWKTLSQAVQCIRPYNLEKLRLLTNVDRTLNKFRVIKM
jgi:8-oxo-dGTP pyrophosphatase MutT (NUDIX family)